MHHEISKDTSFVSPGAAFIDRTFDAVLFDMDGTLISSIDLTERCWGQWMERYGFDPSYYHQFHGTPAKAIIEQLLPAEQFDEAFACILELELSTTQGITALPGAHSLVDSLPDSARAIVTSMTRDLFVLRSEATNFALETVVCADEVERGKPDPLPYATAARMLGVDPSRCLVVEDAPAGLVSGRSAGTATLGVATSHRLDQLTADAYVTTLESVRFEWDASSRSFSVHDVNV